jgi:Lamin Tail Domain
MKKYRFIVILFFCTEHLVAQVRDDFSDGDFTMNPTWSGTVSRFTINSAGQLQLNDTQAGSAYLSTPLQAVTLDNFEWDIYVKQSFSPSGSNFGRVYLASDQPDLSGPLNGYYLQFGEAGSNDALELFHQTGTSGSSICRGTSGAIASSFALRLKVQRNGSGVWTLSVDYSGGSNLLRDATGTEISSGSYSYTGIQCTYTISNDAKFFYDDFYAGQIQTDVTPPKLLSLLVQSQTSLQVIFSEVLDSLSVKKITNYSADHNLGNPLSAIPAEGQEAVILTFQTMFSNGIMNELTISGIRDVSGNVMKDTTVSFLFFQPSAVNVRDVIISELLPDPSPPIGLPDAEFTEIFNRSSSAVDITGWSLSDGTTEAIFPMQILLPGQYLIITSVANASAYLPFGAVIGTPSFPTLNNEGDNLVLKNGSGLTIDSINYSLSWYHDTSREDGGWSLELIDPQVACSSENNWASSDDPTGGTPGRQNSIWATKPDLTGPSLMTATPIGLRQLLLGFDEQLDANAPMEGSYLLDPFVPVVQSRFEDPARRKIIITFESDLKANQLYSIIVQHIYDCNGNPIQEDHHAATFALPESADSLDIIVNEILFNPRPGGVDFVEVYNRSSKYLDLSNWKLSNYDNSQLNDVQVLNTTNFLMSPSSYLVFTSDPVSLAGSFPKGKPLTFIRTNMPSLPDDAGSIALLGENGKIIDYFQYSKGYHSAFIQDDEGVSLERVSFSGSSNDPQNWKSASSQSGFGTPGYLNSNARPDNTVSSGSISVNPEIIVPNSGIQDFTQIIYSFDQGGYIATIRIVDQQGRTIRTIAQNESLNTDGFFRWDGEKDDGGKARMGYYLVWAEIFDVSGMVKTFRKRVIVAGR